MTFLGHSLREPYPSAEMQSVYSTAPADWARISLGKIYLKRLESKNSRKEVKTPLSGDPIGKPNFCFKNDCYIWKKKLWLVHSSIILIILVTDKGREFWIFIIRCILTGIIVYRNRMSRHKLWVYFSRLYFVFCWGGHQNFFNETSWWFLGGGVIFWLWIL